MFNEIDNYIEGNKNELIQRTQELIQIPSVIENSSNANHPFGEPIHNALTYMLDLGNSLGFRTKNVDNYCGYIEFGTGEEMIGIVGHLDVVPAGDSWTRPPFSATVSNNKIYGRGAIDDKGPVISSLFAMKAVMENAKVNKRVRLILGLNEENDWKCINYYKANEEIPTIGFSPDADFPCIYAEKGLLSPYLKIDYSKYTNNPIVISQINTYGNRLNVVPKICSVVLKIDNQKITMNNFIQNLKELIAKSGFEIDIYKIDNHEVKLTSHGCSSHAAHPDKGINAISRILILLDEIFNFYKIPIDLLNFFRTYIGTQYDGKNLKMDFEDESGSLTLNVGDFSLQNNKLQIGMNLRIPVTIEKNKVESLFNDALKNYTNIKLHIATYQKPLYISKDSPLIKTLCNVYETETNSTATPIAIGGATFARAFENVVSFGANFPSNEDMCHQTDEFIGIDDLLLSCKIYAKAILALDQLHNY